MGINDRGVTYVVDLQLSIFLHHIDTRLSRELFLSILHENSSNFFYIFNLWICNLLMNFVEIQIAEEYK